MNKSLKYGLFLLVLGVVVATLLALVNSFTAPIIAKQEIEKIKPLLMEVSPDSEEFVDVTSEYTLPSEVEKVYKDESNNILVYFVATNGYQGGTIKTLVAIDLDSKKIVNAIVTTADKQTPGIGEKVLTHDFEVSNVDASVYASLNVESLKSGEYNMITGATVSSRAVLNGIKIASKHFMGIVGE